MSLYSSLKFYFELYSFLKLLPRYISITYLWQVFSYVNDNKCTFISFLLRTCLLSIKILSEVKCGESNVGVQCRLFDALLILKVEITQRKSPFFWVCFCDKPAVDRSSFSGEIVLEEVASWPTTVQEQYKMAHSVFSPDVPQIYNRRYIYIMWYWCYTEKLLNKPVPTCVIVSEIQGPVHVGGQVICLASWLGSLNSITVWI